MNCEPIRFTKILPLLPRFVKTSGSTYIWHEFFNRFAIIKIYDKPFVIKGASQIKEGTFTNCDPLTEVIISDDVVDIGPSAFYACKNLKTVTMSDNVKNIKAGAFEDCGNLTKIRLSRGLEKIGPNVFKGCDKLHCIVIPESVKKIGGNAFSKCPHLSIVVCKSPTPPTIFSETFANFDGYFYVPDDAVKTYQAAPVWRDDPYIIDPISEVIAAGIPYIN